MMVIAFKIDYAILKSALKGPHVLNILNASAFIQKKKIKEDKSLFKVFHSRDQQIVCNNPKYFGFVNRAGTNEYYMISDILMSWLNGENYCQKYGTHLPSITKQSDLDYLRC
jgi:hypothetical protein